ncbi:MAG: cohesin domain-containing protein [Candidatus Bathyarchaeota archaeon]|nr:cohesin domain-containing protein [Candidatus Bathyarchaeota archaeon]
MKTQFSLRLYNFVFTLLLMLVAFFLVQAALAQAASSVTVSVVPSASSPVLGETFVVNITINNVQNLYGLDIALRWNASVLQALSVNSRLGVESHSDGVLHEQLPNSPIEIIEETLSPTTGEYHIVATSVNPAPSFSGSGNVAIITFNVTGLGQTALELESELADYPAAGEPANLIEHTTVDGSVNVIPEFGVLAVALLLVLATAVVALSKKRLQSPPQTA